MIDGTYLISHLSQEWNFEFPGAAVVGEMLAASAFDALLQLPLFGLYRLSLFRLDVVKLNDGRHVQLLTHGWFLRGVGDFFRVDVDHLMLNDDIFTEVYVSQVHSVLEANVAMFVHDDKVFHRAELLSCHSGELLDRRRRRISRLRRFKVFELAILRQFDSIC